MKVITFKKAAVLFIASTLSIFALGACNSQANQDASSSEALASSAVTNANETNSSPRSYTEKDAAKAKDRLASADKQREIAAARAEEERAAAEAERLAADAERLAAEAEAEAEATAAAEAERAAAEEFEGEVYYEEPIEYYDGGGQTEDSCIPGGVAFR